MYLANVGIRVRAHSAYARILMRGKFNYWGLLNLFMAVTHLQLDHDPVQVLTIWGTTFMLYLSLSCLLTHSLTLSPPPGVQQQRVNAESLLLEAVKQVKVSDLEDDILDLPEEDPVAAAAAAAAGNSQQSVPLFSRHTRVTTRTQRFNIQRALMESETCI